MGDNINFIMFLREKMIEKNCDLLSKNIQSVIDGNGKSYFKVKRIYGTGTPNLGGCRFYKDFRKVTQNYMVKFQQNTFDDKYGIKVRGREIKIFKII